MFKLKKSVLIADQKVMEKKIITVFERTLAMKYISRLDTEYDQGYARGYNVATAKIRSVIAFRFRDVLEEIYDPSYLDAMIKGAAYFGYDPDSKLWEDWGSIHE